MSVSTTALPYGADGYECFVGKGACRKCGTIAYGKRKCHRCHRKYCSACEPASLQKYGDQVDQECCIGCEPFLVVAPAESEPIFELEPESEPIPLHSPLRCKGNRPIHVPLSATCCRDGESCGADYDKQLPNASCRTIATDSDSQSNGDDSSSSSPLGAEQYIPTAILGLFLPQETRQSSSHPEEPQAPITPPSSRSTRLIDLEPPVTPQSGCCTSCKVYSTGKKPCPSCGTKYCHERKCQGYLYEDGTCVKCRLKPRESNIPELPIEAGCCSSCQQYVFGKVPCETCGTKYCKESACQAYLFSNGTCARCHGNM